MGQQKRGPGVGAAQPNLFSSPTPTALGIDSEKCHIVSVGKRRDGGTRYWCLSHKADATAKYGKPAKSCRASHLSPIREEDILPLKIEKYEGGVALWGAVPAVYDTTQLPMDRGIHVHARVSADSEKEMDCTYRAVRILSRKLSSSGIVVSEQDAIYYMVTSVFGFDMRYVTCPYCGEPHLDKDWFSVHPHIRHLCAGCGKHFRDTEVAVGNPIAGIRDACGIGKQHFVVSPRKLDIKQADFPGGIEVWGSNPAFLWTSTRPEEEGVHVHVFCKLGDNPDVDETYGEVVIDGVHLDPIMVRVLMSQSAMPSLANRVVSVSCPSCGNPEFGIREFAFTPTLTRTCEKCGHQFSSKGKLRNVISNPLPGILSRLAGLAPREPQHHNLGLLPETL